MRKNDIDFDIFIFKIDKLMKELVVNFRKELKSYEDKKSH